MFLGWGQIPQNTQICDGFSASGDSVQDHSDCCTVHFQKVGQVWAAHEVSILLSETVIAVVAAAD